jgi:hypothetical protein
MKHQQVILIDGFNSRSRGGDKVVTVGSKTWWWQPLCATPGAANGGIFGTNECGGMRPRSGGPFIGGGTGEPRGEED